MEQMSGPLAQELARLASRIPSPPSATSSTATSSPPHCAGFWSRLPTDAQARLTCLECSGAGRLGSDRPASQPACPSCRGTGLCCPTCRGARFLRRLEVSCKGMPRWEQLTIPCAGCSTVGDLNATIAAYVVAQLQAAAHA